MSDLRTRSMAILRAIAIAWSALLIAFIGTGVMSTQRIGSVTYGPEFDFWAISIAISSIEHGATGQIGHLEVLSTLVDHMTATKREMAVDAETRRMLQQPETITRAIRAAAAVKPEQLQHTPKEQGGYVTTLVDDVGYV